MKLFTYIGLVVRRVWAKKGILFGSLLGATLVIALLVVVPLYESSVQAVDLNFSLAGAVGDDLDMTAFSQMNQYDAATGEVNREIVTASYEQWLTEWYPTIEERSQSREFLVIPTGAATGADWIAIAEAWNQQIAELAEREVPPDEWPPPPYPQPPRDATQVRFFTAPDLGALLSVQEGALPDPLEGLPDDDPAAPLPVVLGSRVATLAGLEVGDDVFLKPFSGQPTTFEHIVVVAIVTPADADATIWGRDDPSRMIFFDQVTFDTWTAPVPISREDDLWLRSARGFPGTSVTQRWRMALDPDTVRLQDLGRVEGSIDQFQSEINKASGGTIPSNTFLPLLLDAFRLRSVTVGGPILAMLALVVGGAIYFLVYTAALTVEREGSDIAQLKTRGASSWQTIGIHLAQSLFIAVVAAAVAPIVARSLVGITGRIPPLSDLTGNSQLDVAQVRSVVPWLIAGGAIAFIAMGIAVIPYARRGVLALRALASRPGQKSMWQKYNLDLFAIALSLVVLFQLVQRGFVNTSGGEVTLDPLAILFPVLLLFTGALILLRLFPFLLRFVGWMMTKSRSMSLALPGWHLGRNPVPYGRLALLVWVTTGLGAFALTYAATLEGSFGDRAAFAAGADVRMVAEGAGYLDVADSEVGAPVLRTVGAPRRSGRQAETLAIRPETFAAVVAWRPDFGAETAEEVFGVLRLGGAAPDIGIEIPAEATHLTMEGVVVPDSAADQERDPERERSHRWMIRAIDAKAQVWTMAADVDWDADAWSTATIDLSSSLNTTYPGSPVPPLSMTSWWVERPAGAGGAVVDGSSLLLGPMIASAPEGEVVLDLTEMTAINQFGLQEDVPADRAALAYFAELPDLARPTRAQIVASPLFRTGSAVQITTPQRTRANPAVPQQRRIPDDLRVLLDLRAASVAGLSVGDESSYAVAGQIFNGEFVGFVERVPTMTDGRYEGKMIVDLDALNAWLNGQGSWSLSGTLSRVDGPEELWVATTTVDPTVRRLSGQLEDEPDQVWTIRSSAASFSSRPVQVGLVAILFVGAATGVILALAGVTGYVLLAVSRRAREMGVLRALGFGRGGVGMTFAVEQLVVIGLGAVIGTLGGIALVWVMVPFLQLGETAEVIEPPISLSVPWDTLVLYIAIVGVLLVLSVLWATRRVSVRRLSEVLREVER